MALKRVAARAKRIQMWPDVGAILQEGSKMAPTPWTKNPITVIEQRSSVVVELSERVSVTDRNDSAGELRERCRDWRRHCYGSLIGRCYCALHWIIADD